MLTLWPGKSRQTASFCTWKSLPDFLLPLTSGIPIPGGKSAIIKQMRVDSRSGAMVALSFQEAILS